MLNLADFLNSHSCYYMTKFLVVPQAARPYSLVVQTANSVVHSCLPDTGDLPLIYYTWVGSQLLVIGWESVFHFGWLLQSCPLLDTWYSFLTIVQGPYSSVYAFILYHVLQALQIYLKVFLSVYKFGDLLLQRSPGCGFLKTVL